MSKTYGVIKSRKKLKSLILSLKSKSINEYTFLEQKLLCAFVKYFFCDLFGKVFRGFGYFCTCLQLSIIS